MQFSTEHKMNDKLRQRHRPLNQMSGSLFPLCVLNLWTCEVQASGGFLQTHSTRAAAGLGNTNTLNFTSFFFLRKQKMTVSGSRLETSGAGNQRSDSSPKSI